jgi:hypothetical protein
MRPIAALLSRFGRDGASEPEGSGANPEPSASEDGTGIGSSRGTGVAAAPDGAAADDRRDGRGGREADGSDGRSDPTHVCAICRSSFSHAPTSCPECGNTAVAPLDDWESSELIRHMSGGG